MADLNLELITLDDVSPPTDTSKNLLIPDKAEPCVNTLSTFSLWIKLLSNTNSLPSLVASTSKIFVNERSVTVSRVVIPEPPNLSTGSLPAVI